MDSSAFRALYTTSRLSVGVSRRRTNQFALTYNFDLSRWKLELFPALLIGSFISPQKNNAAKKKHAWRGWTNEMRAIKISQKSNLVKMKSGKCNCNLGKIRNKTAWCCQWWITDKPKTTTNKQATRPKGHQQIKQPDSFLIITTNQQSQSRRNSPTPLVPSPYSSTQVMRKTTRSHCSNRKPVSISYFTIRNSAKPSSRPCCQ